MFQESKEMKKIESKNSGQWTGDRIFVKNDVLVYHYWYTTKSEGVPVGVTIPLDSPERFLQVGAMAPKDLLEKISAVLYRVRNGESLVGALATVASA